MNTITYIIRQTLLLGTIACVLWLSQLFFERRFSFTADVMFIWFVSVILTGAFLSLICMPIAKLAHGRISRFSFYVLGLCAGPIAVLIYLYASMDLHPSFSQYGVRFWKEHLIFSAIGMIFFVNVYTKINAVTAVRRNDGRTAQ